MSTLDAGGTGEFINVVVAGAGSVETGLDAIAFILDFGECKVDFGDNTSNIETSDV